MKGDGIEKIEKKIKAFQKKYYLNIFVKGVLVTLSILFIYFILAVLVEYTFWLGPWARSIIFFCFIAAALYCTYHFLKEPLNWWLAKRGLNNEDSAQYIGDRLPTVKDRLLNLLQLSRQSSSLAVASIQQRSTELEPISFESTIDLKQNRKFLKYLLIPFGVITLIFLFNSQMITDSTRRIIHFNQHFSPKPPFEFIIENQHLHAFFNEDFTLIARLEGKAVPENIYLIAGPNRFKLEKIQQNKFSYTFSKVQESFDFQLEAAGFYSSLMEMEIIRRPELTGFTIDLAYPNYLHRKNDHLTNAGNLKIPEGSVVTWNIKTTHTNNAVIWFSDSVSEKLQSSDNQVFTYKRRFLSDREYEIKLNNEKTSNGDQILYHVDVIKDEHPKISVNNFNDSVLYKRIVLGGIVGDDYGVTKLNLHYRIKDKNDKEVLSKFINIPILRNQTQQSFVYNWSLDSLRLQPNHRLEYFLQVWDNDGVNGHKSTRSSSYSFFIPTKDELVKTINQSERQAESKISESATKASELQEKIEDAVQRMKGKQNLDWQDKKMLQEILDQKQGLDQVLDQMKKMSKELQDKKDAFTKQDERIKEKTEQILKLMNELLDEETKKLFEELQKLMQENADPSEIQKLLEKLQQNSDTLEKQLDRILEQFKELEYQSKFDQAIMRLEDQIEKQKELMEKTEQAEKELGDKKSNKSPEESQAKNKELANEQEEIKKEMENLKEELSELKEMGKDVQNPADVPEEEKVDDIQKQQDESKEMLQQNQPQKSKENQKKALEKMQEMQQAMESQQNSMEMEINMENLEMLRHIIHGLIKLSFDQEKLLNGFHDLQENDPRFNGLAEEQLKLIDNAKVLEDSLLALAKRDPFMGGMVVKEINELNTHLEDVNNANKEREHSRAQSKMQLSMTAINNLALMLDSHFDAMMQMMANAKPGQGSKNKKGKEPNLSQLQQQLNDRIKELKESGKTGRQLSEELAKMAAEQERIRKAIEEMNEKLEQKGGKAPGGDLPGKMEETELDLVNKRLTDQLIKRQQEILTRLLESEKSMREQDMDDERKGETAKEYEKELPKAMEEYLRLKEKEVELLKTVPPKLYPYYKQEVDEYFKRIGNP